MKWLRKSEALIIFAMSTFVPVYCYFNLPRQFYHNKRKHGLNEHKDILNDTLLLPMIESVQRLVNFSWTEHNEIDATLYTGLFMMKVQLKSILRLYPNKITSHIKQELLDIVSRVNKPINFFLTRATFVKHPMYKVIKSIIYLISDDFVWYGPSNLGAGWLRILEHPDPRAHGKLMTTDEFEKYVNETYDVKIMSPTAEEHGDCLQRIANSTFGSPRCTELDWKCYEFINKKLNVSMKEFKGFSLTRKLLWVILAGNVKNCSFTLNDMDTVEYFCAFIFKEAQMIAANGFKLLNLLVEQIAFCGFGGIADLFIHDWIKNILTYQTSDGCYTTNEIGKQYHTRPHEGDKSWRIINADFNMLNGKCHSHMTGMAAATLGGAIRFVIEYFFRKTIHE